MSVDTHDREIHCGRSKPGTPFLDILRPLGVIIKAVSGDTDYFDVATGKIRGSTLLLVLYLAIT
jgi:hypothetical protein